LHCYEYGDILIKTRKQLISYYLTLNQLLFNPLNVWGEKMEVYQGAK